MEARITRLAHTFIASRAQVSRSHHAHGCLPALLPQCELTPFERSVHGLSVLVYELCDVFNGLELFRATRSG
jgi:hypothetical protein